MSRGSGELGWGEVGYYVLATTGVDAIRRAVRVLEDVGVRALIIHTRNDEARRFYEHLGEFVQSPTDPLHLFLHIKRAKKLMPQD